MKPSILRVSILLIVSALIIFLVSLNTKNPLSADITLTPTPALTLPSATPPETQIIYPIDQYDSRILVRGYGRLVSPQDRDSLICGSEFNGFHTADDLEVFALESNIDVPVKSVSEGSLAFAGFVSGYGGLVVISSQYQDQPVTIYYGHLDLGSVKLKKGDLVTKNQLIGNLGQGCSSQTDGERKHLHFAVRKGADIDFRGYAPSAEELSNWIKPEDFFQTNTGI